MPKLCIGVDGCKGGWLGAAVLGGELDIRMFDSFKELFVAFTSPDLILVDVPTGLIDEGTDGRECDSHARTNLGRRHACVFTPPSRPALDAGDLGEARKINRRLTGKSLAEQAWAIVPKIREVDLFVRHESGARAVVREVHPEILFWALNGRKPMRENKSTLAGRRERLAVLRTFLRDVDSIVAEALARRDGARYQADDVIDALAAAVTGSRGHGRLRTLPDRPHRDAYGLPMEMVYWEPQ